MALIKCPECDKEVSDKAISCPHCGYELPNANKFEKTEIHSVPAKMGSGTIGIFAGIILIPIGIITMFLLSIFGLIIGIVEIVIGIALIKSGKDNVKGNMQEADCPYCGKKIYFSKDEIRIECVYCKQVSVKSDDYLTPVK